MWSSEHGRRNRPRPRKWTPERVLAAIHAWQEDGKPLSTIWKENVSLQAIANDAVVLEDELMTRLEDLSAEEQAKLERMTGVWDDDDEGDADGVTDLTRVIRSRR